jgi:hypothetical protein
MKSKGEIQKPKRFLESKGVEHLNADAYMVWETLLWVLDEEGEEGYVAGNIWVRGNKCSLNGDF